MLLRHRHHPFGLQLLPLCLLLLLLSCALLLAFVGAKEKEEPVKPPADNNDDGETNSVVDEAEEQLQSLKQENGTEAKDLSNGFGTDIEWVAWADAVSVALDLNRPILLLIHKTWCGACQALKKSFESHSKRGELVALSRRFVMVNVEDDEEPEEEVYAPDGRYIPRLFILDKEGNPLPVDNKKNYPSNQQYFPQVPDVLKAMKRGLEQFEEAAAAAMGKEKKQQKKQKEAEAEGVMEEKKLVEDPEKKSADAQKEEEKAQEEEGEPPRRPPAKSVPNTRDKDASREVHPEGIMELEEAGDEAWLADAKAGGCPHAAAKAAKKAREAVEAKAKAKKVADKGKEEEKEQQQKPKSGTTKKKSANGVEKEKAAAVEKQKKLKKKEEKEKEVPDAEREEL